MPLSEFDPHYIRIRQHQQAIIANFTVPFLTEEVNLEQLGHELFALVEQFGCRQLVVSMQGVEYLTSSGVGKLITLHRKMHRVEGVVIFCDFQESVEEILRTSKLLTYFNVAPNLVSALAALPKA